MNQAEVTFLDQIEQRNAAVEVVLGDIDDEPQVVLDHLLARDELAAACPTRPFELLFGRKQRLGADFVEVVLGDVVEQLEFWLDRRWLFLGLVQECVFGRRLGRILRHLVIGETHFGVRFAGHDQR